MKLVDNIDIALFMTSFRGGGAERVMLNLAEEFLSLGYSIQIVVVDNSGQLKKTIPAEIQVIDLGSRRVIRSLKPLKSYLIKNKPKVLLSTQSNANCIAILANILAKKPTKVFVREANNLTENTGKHGTFIDASLPVFIRFLYPLASGIIALSKGVADDLALKARLKRERITVIYNPVVNEKLFIQAQEAVEHPWILHKTAPLLIAVGRLTEQKGFAFLIDVIAEIIKEKPVKLIILGEGNLRETLQTKIKDQNLEDYIHMPGFVDNPIAYVEKSDIYVLSSHWEGLCNSLVQALSLGKKIVSTDCPSGPYEVLAGGQYGTLVRCNDVAKMKQALLKKISEPLKDSEKHTIMAHSKATFSSNAIAKSYLRYFSLR